jgi:hypothetical protein
LEDLAKRWKEKAEANENLTYRAGLIQKMSDLDEWSLMMSMREIDTNSIIKIENK